MSEPKSPHQQARAALHCPHCKQMIFSIRGSRCEHCKEPFNDSVRAQLSEKIKQADRIHEQMEQQRAPMDARVEAQRAAQARAGGREYASKPGSIPLDQLLEPLTRVLTGEPPQSGANRPDPPPSTGLKEGP